MGTRTAKQVCAGWGRKHRRLLSTVDPDSGPGIVDVSWLWLILIVTLQGGT